MWRSAGLFFFLADNFLVPSAFWYYFLFIKIMVPPPAHLLTADADFEAKASEAQAPLVKHSLGLAHGRIAEYLIVAVFLATMALYEWVRYFLKQPPEPVMMSVFALLMIGYVTVRVWLTWPRVRAVKADFEGQRQARVALMALGDRGYYFFEPPHADGVEVATGSVLVGPNGVFAITARTFSRGRRSSERVEISDSGRLLVGGQEAIGAPLVQATRVATWVEGLMEREVDEVPNVVPLLVCPGWDIGKKTEEGNARLVNDQTLSEAVTGHPGKLEPNQLIGACEVLEKVVSG